MPWDDVYAMATPGRVFDMFTNQSHALRDRGTPAGRHADAVRRRPGRGDLDGVVGRGDHRAVRRGPCRALPGSARVVEEARVWRWPMGNVYARPGRQRLQAAIEGPLGPRENIHLAGDYFAELGNLEMAARTGAAAADRVASMLDRRDIPTTVHAEATRRAAQASKASSRR